MPVGFFAAGRRPERESRSKACPALAVPQIDKAEDVWLYQRRMARKIAGALGLIVSDFLAILLSFYLGFFLRSAILKIVFPSRPLMMALLDIYLNHAYLFVIWVFIFAYERLYTRRFSFWDEIRVLMKSTTIAFSLIMISVFITQEYIRFSRAIILLAWIISFATLPLFRGLAKKAMIGMRLWTKKVLLVGPVASAAPVIEAIRANSNLGYEIVGCLCDELNERETAVSGVPVLGRIADLERERGKRSFDDIIVNMPDLPGDQLVDLLRTWERVSDTIHYVPRMGSLIIAGVEIENIGGLLSLTVRKNLAKPWNILIKTLFEFVLAFLLLILLAPFFLLFTVLVKIDSRGSVFYSQERFGKKGQRITMIKFRTMFEDAEDRLSAYLALHPQSAEDWARFKKLKAFDPRVTRIGGFLRKHSLDELPQLWHVLTGKMSLVGPRPYIMDELQHMEIVKSLLLQVKPGLTGLWQISGRSLLPFKERLTLDEHYIRNWSLWLDIVILIKTVRAVATGRGAF